MRAQRVGARSRQFDRERQSIEAAADLAYVRIVGVYPRPRVQGTGPGDEQFGGVFLGERLDGEDVLSGQMEDTAAGHDNREPGEASIRRSRSRPASATCSKLSTTRRSSRSAAQAASVCASGSPGCSPTRRAWAMVGQDERGLSQSGQLDDRDAVRKERSGSRRRAQAPAASSRFRRLRRESRDECPGGARGRGGRVSPLSRPTSDVSAVGITSVTLSC